MEITEPQIAHHHHHHHHHHQPLSMNQWIGVLLLTLLPIVGFVMCIIWSKGEACSKRNFARAALFWRIIIDVLAGVAAYVFVGA